MKTFQQEIQILPTTFDDIEKQRGEISFHFPSSCINNQKLKKWTNETEMNF